MKVKDVPGCQGCPMLKVSCDYEKGGKKIHHEGSEQVFVPPQKGPSTRLAIARDPGEEEGITGVPLSGRAGQFQNSLWRKAGVNRDDLTILNCRQCRPPNNIDPLSSAARFYISEADAKAATAQCWRNHVDPVIKSRVWTRIDALGGEALEALTGVKGGINKWRGSPLPLKGELVPRVIGTYHPSYIMQYGQGAIPTVISDLKKGINVPPEFYNLTPTLEDVAAFRATKFTFDIETNIFTKQITMVGFCDRPYHVLVVPFRGAYIQEIKRIFANATEVTGHNCLMFDLPVLEVAGIKISQECQVWDTILMHHLISPDTDHDLEFVSSVFTQKPAWKHLAEENKELYCARDVDVTHISFLGMKPVLVQQNLIDLYCVAPGTKILKSDLSWEGVQHLQIGDELIGFDEELVKQPNARKNRSRRFKSSIVEDIKRLFKDCVNVFTDRGFVTCSKDHNWLVVSRSHKIKSKSVWKKTSELVAGDQIYFTEQPWLPEKSIDAGYLAGVFDGEGSVCTSNGRLSFAQKEGIVLQKVETLLQERKFVYSKSGKDCKQLSIRALQAQKFLGEIRPNRLLRNSRPTWEDRKVYGNYSSPATITEIQDVGKREVIALQTSTRTFIANGFLSHNCHTQVPLAKICHVMESTGIHSSGQRANEKRKEWLQGIADLEQLLPDELKPYDKSIRVRQPAPPGTLGKSGKPIKYIHVPDTERVVPWRSDDRVKDFLYKTCKFTVQLNQKTKRPTSDKTALEKLANFCKKNNRPQELIWVESLRKISHLDQLSTSFIKGMKDKDGNEIPIRDGHVFPHFSPYGTSQGRLSSSGPNFQNQPPEARYIYVPSDPTWCLVEADFSQGENRLTAFYANDQERLQRLATPGFSEHKLNAEIFFGVAYAEVVKDNSPDALYGRAKKLTHGINYGEGPRKIAMSMDLPEKDVRDWLYKWRVANKPTVDWMERVSKQAEREGVLTNLFTRKRWFWSDRLYGESLSFLPQSTLADIIHRAAVGMMYERINWPVELALKASGVLAALPWPARLLAQVHDSFLIECPKTLVNEVVACLRAVMEQPWPQLGGFNLTAEFSVGQPGVSWGELKPYKLEV